MGRLILCLLALSSLSGRHRKPLPDPHDVQRYGCISQQTAGDPYWHTYAWAQMPGDDTDCARAIKDRTGIDGQFPATCYIEQLSVRDSRKKALADCNDWMDDIKRVLEQALRKSKGK